MVEPPVFPPEAAGISVVAGSVPPDDDEPVPEAGLLELVGEGSDAEPVPGTMVRGVEHIPSRVVRSAALAIAAGVEPQFVYCCMWMALASRSKTAVISKSVKAL